MWVSGSYDPQLNLIYWGTGQPSPDFVGDNREGDNLYTDSIVALDIDTGKMKWHFQNTPHDVHDWDSLEMPVLLDAPFNGQPRKLLLQANRNGLYYILDRTNGKFLRGVPFVSKVDWMSGFSPEGRPILTPGHEPTVQGTQDVSVDRRRDQLAVAGVQPRHEAVLSDRAGRLRRHLSIDDELPARAGGSGTAYMESADDRERWQLYVRALDAVTGQESVGLRAGQLVSLRARAAVDRRRPDLRARAAGHVHRARCEERQGAVEFQYRRADHRRRRRPTRSMASSTWRSRRFRTSSRLRCRTQ